MTKFLNLRQKGIYFDKSKDTSNVYKLLLIMCILHFSIMTVQNFTKSNKIQLENVNIDDLFQTAFRLVEKNKILLKEISALAKSQRVRSMDTYSLAHGVMSTILKTTESVDRVVESADDHDDAEVHPICKGRGKRRDRYLVNAENAVANIARVLKTEIESLFKTLNRRTPGNAGIITPVSQETTRQVNLFTSNDGRVEKVVSKIQALFREVFVMLSKLTDHKISLRRLGVEFYLHLNMSLNPTVCPESKILFCDFRKRDVGSTVHKIVYCVALALSTGRVLRLVPKWPWSSCVKTNAYSPSALVEFEPTDDPQAALMGLTKTNAAIAVDADATRLSVFKWLFSRLLENRIMGRVRLYHQHPEAWVIGQMVSYVIRPLINKTRLSIEEKRIDFRRPIVGVFVSRYDNSSRHENSSRHFLGKYFEPVERFYREAHNGLPLPFRRVLLVSGTAGTYQEAGKVYANRLTILRRKETEGYESSHLTLVYDVLLLARCHFLVCNMSWPPCRLTYELMQTIQTDAVNKVHPLGGSWNFD